MAAGDGLISMTPTSIAYSGTSASINADGGVDFSAVTSLSLNGVFTGDYDNYLMVIRMEADTTAATMTTRMRLSGTDASGSSDYTYQNIRASSGTVSAARSSTDQGIVGPAYTGQNSGYQVHWYGPALAQPTAFRSVSVSTFSGAYIYDVANTHNQSISYDGCTLITTNAFTGNIHVFGYEE